MRIVLFLVALLIGLIPQAAIAADALGDADSNFVARVEGLTTDPRTNGRVIIFIRQIGDLIHPEMQNDLYGVDLITDQRFPIAAGAGEHVSAGISGDIVVWAELSPAHSSGDILGKNLRTGEMYSIAATASLEDSPAIAGDWVIWHVSEPGESDRIMACNLATMAPAITLTTMPTAPITLTLDEDRAIWTENNAPSLPGSALGASISHWRLRSIAIGDDNPVTLAEGSATYQCEREGFDVVGCAFQSGSEIREIASSGGVVVYHELLASGAGRNTVIDLATDQGTSFDGGGTNLTTDGRYVFWSDDASANGQVEGFDVATGSAFSVPASTGSQPVGSSRQMAAQAGLLVWQRPAQGAIEKGQQPSVDLHVASIDSLLPAAQRPDPDSTSSDWTYFATTGHFVSHGFQQFWQENGGVPVFGYALTEEFSEHGQTVQYFERQRFEYHPEHAGSPYVVELGRLGADAAAGRNLTDTQAFQPAAIPSTAVGDTCHYFDETHHAVCGDFLVYWQSHGLDLGDRDVSFRESLALFGYPISEPFIDVETGLWVQYFERSVFEWHPDNPGGWQMELERLGALTLATRGW